MEDCCKGVPSGNWLHSYEKWPIEIVDLPIKNGGSFHRFLGLFTISGNVFANQDMAARDDPKCWSSTELDETIFVAAFSMGNVGYSSKKLHYSGIIRYQ